MACRHRVWSALGWLGSVRVGGIALGWLGSVRMGGILVAWICMVRVEVFNVGFNMYGLAYRGLALPGLLDHVSASAAVMQPYMA